MNSPAQKKKKKKNIQCSLAFSFFEAFSSSLEKEKRYLEAAFHRNAQALKESLEEGGFDVAVKSANGYSALHLSSGAWLWGSSSSSSPSCPKCAKAMLIRCNESMSPADFVLNCCKCTKMNSAI